MLPCQAVSRAGARCTSPGCPGRQRHRWSRLPRLPTGTCRPAAGFTCPPPGGGGSLRRLRRWRQESANEGHRAVHAGTQRV